LQYTGSFTGTALDSFFATTVTCAAGHYVIGGYCGALHAVDNEAAHVVYFGPNLTAAGGTSAQSTQFVCWIAHGRTTVAVDIRYGILCQ
jgi:hypothetical protein